MRNSRSRLRDSLADPRNIDRALAIAGIAGALANASAEPHRDLNALAVVALMVLMGSVAFRRDRPIAATLTAISALAVFQAVSLYNGDGTFEAAAICFNFYLLGQRTRSVPRLRWVAACLVSWLIAAVLITYDPGQGSVGGLAGTFALFGPVPFVCGFLLAIKGEANEVLARTAAHVDSEQWARSRQAAARERARMARELHDVIAHCVSVMVVQTGGARAVAASDPEAARKAMQAVGSAGREALGDLRRLVGTIRRDVLADGQPGTDRALPEVSVLIERARAAGVPVDFDATGAFPQVPPGVASAAYRLVQEGLTNVIKHARSSPTKVSLVSDRHFLTVSVSDAGDGVVLASAFSGSGHGLAGMSERVAELGGTFASGPRRGGGFQVRARLPLAPPAPGAAGQRREPVLPARTGARDRLTDALLAAGSLAVMETVVLMAAARLVPTMLSALAGAGIALAVLARRRLPLASLLAVEGLAAAVAVFHLPGHGSPLLAAFLLLVPSYSVAAWASGRKAAAGLVLMLGLPLARQLTSRAWSPADLAGTASVIAGVWGVGYAVRVRRERHSQLGRDLDRLVAEGDDRSQLAVAAERSRIARDLHEALASSVSAMVVQAEAAASQIGPHDAAGDTAMVAIEETGRQVLAEMRHILGVLRHQAEATPMAPPPGIDQIYVLIQHARAAGQAIELRVEGDPGVLPAAAELGTYRLIEEAIQAASRRKHAGMSIRLVFAEHALTARVSAHCGGPNGWPTETMRERITLCGGHLSSGGTESGWHLEAHLPRSAKAVYT